MESNKLVNFNQQKNDLLIDKPFYFVSSIAYLFIYISHYALSSLQVENI